MTFDATRYDIIGDPVFWVRDWGAVLFIGERSHQEKRGYTTFGSLTAGVIFQEALARSGDKLDSLNETQNIPAV